MAPWQFKTKLIPRVVAKVDDLPAVWFVDDEDPAAVWVDYAGTSKLIADLSRLLKEDRSWSAKAKMFGESKGDRIEIWEEGAKIAWILIAFDLSHLNPPLIKSVTALAARSGCVFVDVQSRLLFEPNVEAFVHRAQGCSASRYGKIDLELLAAGD